MLKGFIGQKVKMTSGYDTYGRWVPVTVVKAPKNIVYQLKTKDTDKYESAQIGIPGKKNANKPLLGLAKKLDKPAPVILKEFSYSGKIALGEEIAVNTVIRKGEVVDVSGVSKGKGFAGGMKRHGFHGGPRTHGQSDRGRAPGSIGSGTTPGRVYKGKRMAGHMGVDNVTVKNLEVLDVDKENELVYIKGAVPGINSAFVVITKTGKKTKAYVEPEIPAVGTDEPTEEAPVEAASESAPAPEAEGSAE